MKNSKKQNENLRPLKKEILKTVSLLVISTSSLFFIVLTTLSMNFVNFQKNVQSKDVFITTSNNIRDLLLSHVSNNLNKNEIDHLRSFTNKLQSIVNEHSNILGPIRTAYLKKELKKFNVEGPLPLTQDNIIQLNEILREVIQAKEKSLYNITLEYVDNQKYVLLISLLLFILTVALVIYYSNKLFGHLSSPITDLYRLFSGKVDFTQDLELPKPYTHEQDRLQKAISQKWKQIIYQNKEHLKAIDHTNTKFSTLLSSMDDIVFITNEKRAITFANDAFYKLLNIKESDMQHAYNWREIPNLKDRDKTSLEKIMRHRKDGNIEVSFQNEEGETNFLCRVRAIINEQGSWLGQVVMMDDITESKSQERLQKDFVAVLSHELKTPIQSLMTASELLQDLKDQAPSQIGSLYDTILEDVIKIKTIATDFVSFSRSEIKELDLSDEKIDIHTHIIRALEPLRNIAKEKDITVKLKAFDNQELEAHIDPVKFSWAIHNIVSNSCKYSPAGGKIDVSLMKENTDLIIKIKDETAGIDEEDQKKIFQPFYQGVKRGGLGIELSIANEIIKAHGGSIEYRKISPKGSIFTINMPLISEQVEEVLNE